MNTEQTNQDLRQHFDSLELAEDYGVLCGLLCLMDESNAGALWRSHSSLLESADAQSKPLLEQLIMRTHANLYSDDFGFELLLPEDNDDLQLRLYALSNYCRGLLSGIGMSGVTELNALEDDVQSFIKDIGMIAEGGIDAANTEEDEANYAELTEYVRAGTMLVARDQIKMTDKRTLH